MRNVPNNAPENALTLAALVAIYIEIRPRLERAIARRLGSRTLASDLAQEMFFQVRSIKTPLFTIMDAERYFFRIAVNASLDHLKIEARRRQILEQSASVFQRTVDSPEAEMFAADQLRLVESALSDLPARCRDILILSRVEGVGHADIAKRLGVSRSLVEKYIVMALLHCRQRLSRDWGL